MQTPVLTRRSFLASAAVGAALCAPNVVRAEGKQIRLRVSSSLPTDEYSEHYFWFQRFQSNLATAVGDRIRLDYYPNGQLGKENDTVQQVKTGTIDLMISGSSYWATLVPEIGMLDLGYLFDSYDQMKKHLHGSVGEKLAQMVADRTKVSIIGWTSTFGARSIYTKKPVASLADIKEMKIRVLPVPAFIQTFEAMNAIPTPVPLNELYTALQTGIVDGFEQNAPTVLGMKLFETSKACYLSEHMFLPLAVAASPRAMSTLPAEIKAALITAAAEAAVHQLAETPAKVAQATEALKKAGVVFTPMSADDRKAARAAVTEKVWGPFTEKYPRTRELVAEIDRDRG
jgi:tripartite ATP-independent transporter DctP family solute receptor